MRSKLILGTVQLGLDYGINNHIGRPTYENACEILHYAYDNGIKILDTAEAYGNSQDIIGLFHKENPNKRFEVITKIDANHNLRKDELIVQIKKNLNTLSIAQLYGYMFHNYKSFKNSSFLYDEILRTKTFGLVKKVGISLYSNEEIEDVITNYAAFDFIQIPFNLLDNASKRAQLIIRAKEKHIEIHTRSVFLQGLFFKSSNELPNKLSFFSESLKRIELIKEELNLTTEMLALQYALQKEYIDQVLIGVDTKDQLIANLSICNDKLEIPHDFIDNIDIKDVSMLNPANWNK